MRNEGTGSSREGQQPYPHQRHQQQLGREHLVDEKDEDDDDDEDDNSDDDDGRKCTGLLACCAIAGVPWIAFLL